MKLKLLITILVMCCFVDAYSQSSSINYKALIKDNSGNVIANQTVTIQLTILEDATSVYQETHTQTTGANGIVVLNIGEGSVDSGIYATINWGADDHFLNVKTDIGSGLVDLGTTQFLSVPYANFAEDTRKGTLNDGYNKGGNGLGRIINATDGKVEITGDGLEIITASDDTVLFVDGQNNRVGIGTDNPKGVLDISSNYMGAVMPRVSDLSSVTDGDGNPPVDGTLVFDTSNKRFCIFTDGDWLCLGLDKMGNTTTFNTSLSDYEVQEQSYFKASNTAFNNFFGMSLDISGDGLTMAVGAPKEGSIATTINGDESRTSSNRGAVYVFHYDGTQWQQEAYIKPSTLYFSFGMSVSLSLDGNTLAVGRDDEAFIYRRTSGIWTEQQQIVYPEPFWGKFGANLDLSDDGNTIAISAIANTSIETGVGANPAHSTGFIRYYGGVYIYVFNGTTWEVEEFFKPNVIDDNITDSFGFKVALSGDATVLAVSAPLEDSNATGLNGDESNNDSPNSGAVYVYRKNGGTWQFDTFIKASNADAGDRFGYALAISSDGHTIAVGAPNESGGFPGINTTDGTNNYKSSSGAVYIFNDSTDSWVQDAYIKNTIIDNNDLFGYSSIAINTDGSKLVVGAHGEDSLASGVSNTASANNEFSVSGAAFVFQKNQGVWSQTKMLKATNPKPGDQLTQAENTVSAVIPGQSGLSSIQHNSNNIAISANGGTIIVGSLFEDSNATGIQGNQNDTSANNAGAVYLYKKVN